MTSSSNDDPNRPFKLARPRQIDELTPDQVVAVVLRLSMEICVLRDRLSTHEQLLAEQNLLTPERIDEFRPSKDEASARKKARDELIESIIDDLS